MFQTAICFDKKVQIKMRVRSENNGILKNIRNFAAKQKGYMIMTDERECATCNTNHSLLNLKPPKLGVVRVIKTNHYKLFTIKYSLCTMNYEL